MRRACLLALMSVGASVGAACQAAPSKCGDRPVSFRANPPELKAKIHVRRLRAGQAEIGSGSKEMTAQGTRWLVTRDANYMLPGPWSTTYFVGTSASDRPDLELRIAEHGSTIAAKWISEKLLYVEVWWGRFGATDLILDVASGKVLYSEFGDYRQVSDPCKED